MLSNWFLSAPSGITVESWEETKLPPNRGVRLWATFIVDFQVKFLLIQGFNVLKNKVLKNPQTILSTCNFTAYCFLVIKLTHQWRMPPHIPSPTLQASPALCLACDWLGGSPRISLFPATDCGFQLGAQEPCGVLARKSTVCCGELIQR